MKKYVSNSLKQLHIEELRTKYSYNQNLRLKYNEQFSKYSNHKTLVLDNLFTKVKCVNYMNK